VPLNQVDGSTGDAFSQRLTLPPRPALEACVIETLKVLDAEAQGGVPGTV
jgi:hypothetical protein